MLAIASVINELSLNFRQKQVREVTHQLLDMMKEIPFSSHRVVILSHVFFY